MAQPAGLAPALPADIELPLEDPMAGREQRRAPLRPSAPLPSQMFQPEYTDRRDTGSPTAPRRTRLAAAPPTPEAAQTAERESPVSVGSQATLSPPARRSAEAAPSIPLRGDVSASAARPLTSQRVEQWAQAVGDALEEAAPSQGSLAPPSVIAFEEATPTPRLGWSYEVQRGDSLWHIGERLWTENPCNRDVDRTWRLLFEWNDEALGSDPDLIHPGQVLEIPIDTRERHLEAQ